MNRARQAFSVPRLVILAEVPEGGSLQLTYSIHWDTKATFGPEDEPDWITDVRCQNPTADGSILHAVDPSCMTDLADAFAEIYELAGKEPANEGAWREVQGDLRSSLNNYSAILGHWFVDNRIRDHLLLYSSTCLDHKFPPALKLQSNLGGILWHLATLADEGPPECLEKTWARCLALGLETLPPDDERPGEQASVPTPPTPRNPRALVAVATRMVRNWNPSQAKTDLDRNRQASSREDLTAIRCLLASWDPWGFTSEELGDPQPAIPTILFDPEYSEAEPGKWPSYFTQPDAAELILYQGHRQGSSPRGVWSGIWRDGKITASSSSTATASFELQKLGGPEAGRTLVLAGCNSTEVDLANPLLKGWFTDPSRQLPRSGSLLAAQHGLAWIGNPFGVDNSGALRFSRVFLHTALADGAPVGELLRRTIDKLSGCPNPDYTWLTYVLHGDAQRLLPFVQRVQIFLNIAKVDRPLLGEFGASLEKDATIPVNPSYFELIENLDNEFLRALGLDGTHPPSPVRPQVWPVSLSALGRALFHTDYRTQAGRPAPRLRILSPAFVSRGANRLVVAGRTKRKRGEVMTRLRSAELESPLFTGFGKDSFVGTLLRIWLRSCGFQPAVLNDDKNFGTETNLQARRSLLHTWMTGVLFWGGDFLGDDTSARAARKVARIGARGEHGVLDLDSEVVQKLRRIYGLTPPQADGTPPFFPMLFFVAIEGSSPPERLSYFAVREFLRAFASFDTGLPQLRPSHPVHGTFEAETGNCLLVKRQPSHFSSVTDLELDLMAAFIAEALAGELWGPEIGLRLDDLAPDAETETLPARTFEAVRSLVEESLAIPPSQASAALDKTFGDLALEPTSERRKEFTTYLESLLTEPVAIGKEAPSNQPEPQEDFIPLDPARVFEDYIRCKKAVKVHLGELHQPPEIALNMKVLFDDTLIEPEALMNRISESERAEFVRRTSEPPSTVAEARNLVRYLGPVLRTEDPDEPRGAER